MAKGGARYGAGRPTNKIKGEQLQRIDVRTWAGRGLLNGAGWFSWAWNRGGESSGRIGVRVDSTTALTLQYTVTINGDKLDVNERVAIAHTACNFGGTRSWFQCTRCTRRVAVLYMRAGRFACRHCQRVSYTSQSEDEISRTWRTQQKIEARLGDYGQRPKGMRLHTYQRLRATVWDCEQRRDEAFAIVVERFLRPP